jgi:hypothetical protein
MNQKKRALNSIIKALRRNKKRYIAIAFEGDQVILTDSHAALIIPLEDINDKDKERIEKLFYGINVFNDKDHDHRIQSGGHCQSVDKTMYQFLHDKFINDQEYTDEGLSFNKVINHALEGRIFYNIKELNLLQYTHDDISVYIDQVYEDLIYNPKTVKDYDQEGKLRATKQFISNIENSIAIVMPYVYNEEKEGKENE